MGTSGGSVFPFPPRRRPLNAEGKKFLSIRKQIYSLVIAPLVNSIFHTMAGHLKLVLSRILNYHQLKLIPQGA